MSSIDVGVPNNYELRVIPEHSGVENISPLEISPIPEPSECRINHPPYLDELALAIPAFDPTCEACIELRERERQPLGRGSSAVSPPPPYQQVVEEDLNLLFPDTAAYIHRRRSSTLANPYALNQESLI